LDATFSSLPDSLILLALAVVFLGGHLLMLWQAIEFKDMTAVDVSLYGAWVEHGWSTGWWMGVNLEWVYPVGALAPMLLAAVFGTDGPYLGTWCAMIGLLNLATMLVAVRLVSLRRAALPLAGWFVFLGLLGPVGIARLDAVMMPLVLLALLVAGARPALASCLVTVSAWIKVAGAGVMAPLLAVARSWRERLLGVVLPAALTCLGVVLTHRLAGGDLKTLTSFAWIEGERGLQVEAVLATPVVLAHAIKGEPLAHWNNEIATMETWGPGAEAAIRVSDFAMPAVVVLVGLLCWLGRRRATDSLLLGSLAILVGLIVTHKVGSPQFIAWAAPPAVAALCLRRSHGFWGPIMAALLAAAALTNLLYPWLYHSFLGGQPLALAVWVLRNLILVGVLTAAVVALIKLARVCAAERPRGALAEAKAKV
jgi:hypothetical protein